MIYPQRPPMTFAHILKAHELVNLQVTLDFLRVFGIKEYLTDKSHFLVLFSAIFSQDSFNLLQKFSYYEKTVGIFYKWITT